MLPNSKSLDDISKQFHIDILSNMGTIQNHVAPYIYPKGQVPNRNLQVPLARACQQRSETTTKPIPQLGQLFQKNTLVDDIKCCCKSKRISQDTQCTSFIQPSVRVVHQGKQGKQAKPEFILKRIQIIHPGTSETKTPPSAWSLFKKWRFKTGQYLSNTVECREGFFRRGKLCWVQGWI